MRTQKEIKFLTKLLNIEGVKVISQRQHEGIGIILQLEQIGKESSCPRCATKSHRLHQNHRYLVKDLPWGKDVSPTLKLMHELKEKLRKIFEQTNNWLVGLLKLGRWLSGAKKYFPDSQNTILRWLDEIIAYFDHKTTSGVVEGINNKLKLIKRSAYGFRNFENFRIRCLLTWQLNC